MNKSICMNRLRRFLMLASVLLIASVAPVAAAGNPTGPLVKVAILTQQYGYMVTSNGPYEIVDVSSGKVLGDYAKEEKLRIGLRDGQLVINNTVANTSGLKIQPKAAGRIERTNRIIELNNRRYPGVIEIGRSQGKNGLTAINILPVDDYVYSLMIRDVSQEWPEEALKAQAVAIRTFALHELGHHREEGFDFCATKHCQTYIGLSAEDERALKAVNDTKGMVLTRQGHLIVSPFHLSSGGYTENGDVLWPQGREYLRGRPDYDQTSPFYRWQKRMSPRELETLLKSGGYDVGELNAIEISKRKPSPMTATDRGISGRIKSLLLIGKTGVVTIEGEKFRELLSLPSTLIDMYVAVTMTSVDGSVIDSYGDRDNKQIQINLPPSKSGGLLNDSDNVHRISGRKDEMIFLEGYGSGHGVGLSLWGAKAMAEKAINPGPEYYVTILKYYYQGVKIDKWY